MATKSKSPLTPCLARELGEAAGRRGGCILDACFNAFLPWVDDATINGDSPRAVALELAFHDGFNVGALGRQVLIGS